MRKIEVVKPTSLTHRNVRIKLNHGTTTLTDNRQLVDMYLLHRPPVEFLKALGFLMGKNRAKTDY